MKKHRVDIKIKAGGEQATSKAKPNKYPGDLDSVREFEHNNPQFEFWQVYSTVRPGVFDLKRSDGVPPMRSVRPINNRVFDIATGSTVLVGFYDSDRNRPFIMSAGPKLNPDEGAVYPDFYTNWLRWTALSADNFCIPTLDTEEEDQSVVMPNISWNIETPEAVEILRAYGSILWKTHEEVLSFKDEDLETTGSIDFGAPIHGMWLNGAGIPYTLVYGAASSSTPTCGDAQAAAAVIGPSDFDAYIRGFDAYSETETYNPELAYSDASYLSFHPAPSPYAGDPTLEECWETGLFEGFVEGYNLGFVDAGGTVP